jgi:hypothetical protein
MTWTMCTSGAAILRAGLNANAALIAYTIPARLDSLSTQAEGLIEAETGMAIKDNFAGYVLSGAASMACAAQIAMGIIAYDTTGYIAREADTLLNMNDTDYKTAIKNMKDFSKTTLSNPN